MIDPEHALASWFMLISSAVFLVGYALPLLFVPMTWARWFRWEVPEKTHLAIYLGRCLGAVALSIIVVVVRGAGDPRGHRVLFDLIALVTGLMTLVHTWGAIRRIQPWTEHVEIGLYALVTGLALWIGSGL